MRQSELFTKVQKSFPKDEEALNARWLIRAGFVSKEMAGVYSFLPLGLRVVEKIAGVIREEMAKIGGEEVLLSVLHPKENWQETKRWDTLDVLFKLKGRDGREMALGPTHEEVIVPLAKKFISSYQDLPVYLYQIQTKFRDEPRAKSGLLRGREFLMKDLYSFHADEADLGKYYEKVKKSYGAIFRRLDLSAIIVKASGGTFSEFSHEFQVLSGAGEDTIFHCPSGDFAQNREIFKGEAGSACPNCGKPVKSSRGIEVGNIFPLGTGFSDPFHLTYRGRDGKEKLVVMGCYGIGLGRLMGAIVETHHDEAGIIWPETVSPYRVHLLALRGKAGKGVVKAAEALYAKWREAGVSVLYDDRDASPGEKLTEADILGIPYRAVVSEKTGGKIEIKRRHEKAATLIDPRAFIKRLTDD